MLELAMFFSGVLTVMFFSLQFFSQMFSIYIKNSWVISPATHITDFKYSIKYSGFAIFQTVGITLIYLSFNIGIVEKLLILS